MAGINSGLMNIVFDYSKEENTTILLGVTTSIGGICGFVASLVGGKILGEIQNNGNSLLGIEVYGQQILSFISFVGIICIVLYMKLIISKIERK